MKKRFLDFSRKTKILILLLLDLVICFLSEYIALGLRVDEWVMFSNGQILVGFVSYFVVVAGSFATNLYFYAYRHFGRKNVFLLLKIFTLNASVLSLLLGFVGVPNVPRSIAILLPLISLFITIAFRIATAEYLSNNFSPEEGPKKNPKRILIYGAGSAGRQLAAALEISKEMKLLGYIDKNPSLHEAIINGLRVYSDKTLSDILPSLQVDEILLAIPSLSLADKSRICRDLLSFRTKVRILPGVTEMASGRVDLSSIRDLEISDLLGRSEVAANLELMKKAISNKTILVTGGGGSIGGGLIRQIILLQPKSIIIIEHNEYALYQLVEDINAKFSHLHFFQNLTFIPIIGSIQDKEFIHNIFCKYNPEVVYHAAAYKHVPLVELNWAEGIKNNVIGTLNCVEACLKYGVSDFILISSDKAVRPTNIMGATKRLSEMLVQAYASEIKSKVGGPRFSMVRFGNVLGSSGSVVPLFTRQIKAGGPVTVTDSKVTRYFMTIEEAVQLVIQAGSLAMGGDVFLLDMGEPVNIYELAKKMINLYGFSVKNEENPYGDIEIKITGLRPGEKLYEELLLDGNSEPTINPKIKMAKENFLPLKEVQAYLGEILTAVRNDDLTGLKGIFKNIISGYKPN